MLALLPSSIPPFSLSFSRLVLLSVQAPNREAAIWSLGADEGPSMVTPSGPGATERTNARRWTSVPGTTTSAQLFLLQILVTIVLCYQLLFSQDALLSVEEQRLVLLGLMLLLGGVMLLPLRVREAGWFIGALVLGDTAATSAIIYLSGNARSELYLTYFVIVLIAAFTPTVRQFIVLAVILCAAYGGILYLGVDALGSLTEGHLLQIPVLLIMALFYGSSAEMLRREREEKAHLLETIAALSRSEEVLREREQRFGLTIDHANDAIFYLDVKGMIRWANGRAEVITGHPMKALVERPLMSLLSPESPSQPDPRPVADAEHFTPSSLVEFKIVRPDGRPIWLELSSAPVKEQGIWSGGWWWPEIALNASRWKSSYDKPRSWPRSVRCWTGSRTN